VVLDLVQDAEPRPLSPELVLAAQEGRRMALHPSSLLGLLVCLWYAVAIAPNGPRDAFDVVTAGTTFFLGVPVYFAANLVASRDRRADSGELLAATPVPEQARVRGLILATLVPAGAALALVLLGHTVLLETGRYDPVPDVWHLVTGPVTVLGAALLGVMVARWAPVPGAAALVMVAMVAWNVVWANRVEHWAPLGTYMSWSRWNQTPAWAGYLPGSAGWHVAYLLGLCAMAVAGSLLPGAASRWRVLVVGGALTALTVVLAQVQLT
jgi:hypothetical protein